MSFGVPVHHRPSASQKALCIHTGPRVFYMPFGVPVYCRATTLTKPRAYLHAYWPQGLLHAIWGDIQSQAHCSQEGQGPSACIQASESSTCHLGCQSITGLLPLKNPRALLHSYWPQGLLHAIWGAGRLQAYCILKILGPFFMNTGLKVFYIPFEVPFNHRPTASQKAPNHFQANWPQGLASTGLYTHKGLSVFYMPFGLPVNQRPTASQKPLAPHFAYWPQDFLHAIWGDSKSQAHCLSKSLFGVPVSPTPTAFLKKTAPRHTYWP